MIALRCMDCGCRIVNMKYWEHQTGEKVCTPCYEKRTDEPQNWTMQGTVDPYEAMRDTDDPLLRELLKERDYLVAEKKRLVTALKRKG